MSLQGSFVHVWQDHVNCVHFRSSEVPLFFEIETVSTVRPQSQSLQVIVLM